MNRVIVLILILFATSCHSNRNQSEVSHNESTTIFSGTAMTMAYKVIIGEKLNESEVSGIDRLIAETFDTTNTILNKWNTDSELSHVNRLPANTPIVLSPLLLRLFNETDEIVKLSEGRFDPTIEPLQALWKKNIASGKAPSPDEIEAVSPILGWDKIDITDGVLTKQHSGTKLDFGGIAKGLCIDLICEAIEGTGISDYYVEWGGEIRAGGKHPEGRPWRVFIARLNDTHPENAVAVVDLNNQSIATSGDYLQNWTLNEQGNRVTYFHIFDPKSMKPLQITPNSVASTSVLSKSCAFADGIATVAMMFPTSVEAETWAESITNKYPHTKVWIVSRNL